MLSKSKYADLYDLLIEAIPKDHSGQVNSTYFIDYVLANGVIEKVMDLGCGVGNSVELFHKKDPKIKWVGVDIESSPEVCCRTRSDADFITYDGVHLPFKGNSIDLVFSNQVFEHVRSPQELLKEISRVLKPGKCFTGSVSYLEPYHSFSLWNYTPYGFKLLLEEAGLILEEVRPGIDSLTLIIRSIFGRPKFFDRYWQKESFLNALIELVGHLKRKDPQIINLVKLRYCGQFVFLARRER